MLSHPVTIAALVGHYPTNKLIVRGPIFERNHTIWSEDVIRYYCQFPNTIPVSKVHNHALLSLSPLSTS